MTMTDSVADYLTRVRNALRAGHKKVDVPASNLKRALTKLLEQQHLILGFTEVAVDGFPVLRIQLKYNEETSVITGLKRVSTPGLRKYANADSIPRVYGGLGIAVISTSRGLMTDKQARLAKVGGEVLCEIW